VKEKKRTIGEKVGYPPEEGLKKNVHPTIEKLPSRKPGRKWPATSASHPLEGTPVARGKENLKIYRKGLALRRPAVLTSDERLASRKQATPSGERVKS